MTAAGSFSNAILRAVLLAAAGLALAGGARAVPVYGTDASGELVGSRDVGGGGLTGFNEYANGTFTVSWTISIVDANTVHYAYTFTGIGRRDISNLVIDLSDDCTGDLDPECVTGAMIGGTSVGVVTEIDDFAGITGAVKLEGIDGADGVTYEFDSNRLPVYGHLAVKDGGGSATCADALVDNVGGTHLVCSNGLLAGIDTEDTNDYVARPNGLVPEPGTAALLGLGLLSLAAGDRRGRRIPRRR